jgi:hypothetical protein
MRHTRTVVLVFALSLILVLATGVAAVGGVGCSKESTHASGHDGEGDGCRAKHASGEQGPCCAKQANEQALAALQTAAADSGCPKAAAALQAAELAVKQTQTAGGCSKSRASAEQAAMVALQEAADASGCPKAQTAVKTALATYNDEQAEDDTAATEAVR